MIFKKKKNNNKETQIHSSLYDGAYFIMPNKHSMYKQQLVAC